MYFFYSFMQLSFVLNSHLCWTEWLLIVQTLFIVEPLLHSPVLMASKSMVPVWQLVEEMTVLLLVSGTMNLHLVFVSHIKCVYIIRIIYLHNCHIFKYLLRIKFYCQLYSFNLKAITTLYVFKIIMMSRCYL